MARTTISIPDELRKRMDRVKEPINWSAIAAEAFELKLGDIARKQQEKTMDSVINRLRASKLRSHNEEGSQAGKFGEEWAKNAAEFDELRRATEVANASDDFFAGEPLAPYGFADYLAFHVLGLAEGDFAQMESDGFWIKVGIDPKDPRLQSQNFLRSFVSGAGSIFGQVEDQLG